MIHPYSQMEDGKYVNMKYSFMHAQFMHGCHGNDQCNMLGLVIIAFSWYICVALVKWIFLCWGF